MKPWAWVLALCLGVAHAQDHEREKRWASEVVPNLVVGDAVSIREGRPFLGIYTEVKAAKTAVLLVHGMGVHPDHGVIGSLRASLADLGYATLSIQMPVQRSEASAEDYPALFPEAAERIQAGARWLADKGHGRMVLLSHSMGSRMANAYLERATADLFAGWVSLGITADYSKFAALRLPVLDVYAENDFPAVIAANPRRRAAIAAAGSRQVMVPGADHYYTGREKELAAAIAAFLDR
jgi:alpha/beta superfamily hydrolase